MWSLRGAPAAGFRGGFPPPLASPAAVTSTSSIMSRWSDGKRVQVSEIGIAWRVAGDRDADQIVVADDAVGRIDLGPAGAREYTSSQAWVASPPMRSRESA
jgi:hypothetical protein